MLASVLISGYFRNMDISINEQNSEWLRQKVESGKFASADEVLELARELFDERDEALAKELEDVRRSIDIGIQQLSNGEYTEYTDETLHELFDDIRRRGRERLAAENGDCGNN